MGKLSLKRALQRFRGLGTTRSVVRFEVDGLDIDRELIRTLARRLARDESGALQLRAAIRRVVVDQPRKGHILAALRRSPLLGADLDLAGPFDAADKAN